MSSKRAKPTIGLIWRGDPANPAAPTKYGARLAPVAAALEGVGFSVRSIVYFDAQAEAAARALAECAGALVWVNPIADGQDRAQLDALLRTASAQGAWISAHPDVIAKIGVKDVLFETRHLSWGVDCARYDTLAAFEAAFPASLNQGPRVLKPSRGNDGRGVLKVVRGETQGELLVQEASEAAPAPMSFRALAARVAPVFAAGARLIDQECLPTHAGMVRCYMSGARVLGFGVQEPKDDARPFAMKAAKAMHGADAPIFADLRAAMEADWTPAMLTTLDLREADLPALWDADFLWRAPGDARGGGRFALCEINASCVSPFPDAAPQAIAAYVRARLA